MTLRALITILSLILLLPCLAGQGPVLKIPLPSGDKILDTLKDIIKGAVDASKEPARRRSFVQDIKYRLHDKYPDYNVATCDLAQICTVNFEGAPDGSHTYQAIKYGKDLSYGVWVFNQGTADFCNEKDTEGAVNLDGGLYDWHSRNGGNVINLKKTIVPSLPDIGMGKGLRNASDGCVVSFDVQGSTKDPSNIDPHNDWGDMQCETTMGSPKVDDVKQAVQLALGKPQQCSVDNCCGSHCNEVTRFKGSRVSVCGQQGRSEPCVSVAELAETLMFYCQHTFDDKVARVGGQFTRFNYKELFKVEISSS